jgi:DNA invertase Pin-like site-specific DNA recombinase
METKVEQEKKKLLEALANTSGIVSSACKQSGVSRMTYYRWYNEDTEFKEKADDIKELQKDFAESLILKKMKEGDTTMIIFYAKTQMKDRGYTERSEITGKDGTDLIKTKEVDLADLSETEREVLLKIGQKIINKKE